MNQNSNQTSTKRIVSGEVCLLFLVSKWLFQVWGLLAKQSNAGNSVGMVKEKEKKRNNGMPLMKSILKI